MASRKRSRHAEDVDGETEIEIQSASSSLRQSHAKRSRVTMAAEQGGSVVSDEDDYLEEEQEGAATRATPMVYSDDEGEDDKVDELRMTQILQKQHREHRDNIAAEEGVIEEVFCRNFMCHTKLRIKLGPLINFIIGHNGSGKSAVLTALTMCLGGKATTTNRGASLKSLIKEGEENATLAVKIKNRGDSAYKPDIYGKSITVERHFSRSGTSGFKLKNADDRIVSTKKSDLDDMLDYFAFQLDNPINVLTQDMARQFLSNSTPSDKYKFFIRGTQLETLDGDYKILEEHLDNIEAKLRSRQADISILEDKAKEAERRKKRLDRTQAIQERIDRTQWMHAWAQVEEQERILEQYSQEVETASQKIEDKLQEAETVSGAYDGHHQSFEAAERNVAQLTEQLQPVKDEQVTALEAFNAHKSELMEIQNQQRIIKEDCRGAKAEVQRLESDVAHEQDRLTAAEGPEHAANLEKLEQLKEAAKEAERLQMEHGTGIAELHQARDGAFEAHEAAKPLLAESRDSLDRAKGALSHVERSQGRPFDAYRPNMEQLVRAVKNENRWRSQPVGPLGQHVRLLKPEWSGVLEKTFGGVLESFVVTNAADKDLLSQVMGKVNCRTAIYIGDPEPLDTTGKEPAEHLNTIMRSLVFDNDAARNTLIINQAIEQTALVDSHAEAADLVLQRNSNVKVAICPNDKSAATRYETTRTGQSKSSPVHKWTGRPRMATDREEQIRMAREEVNVADEHVQTNNNVVRKLQLDLNRAGSRIKDFENEQRRLKLEVQRADDAVEDLQNKIESNRPQDGKLQELQHQLTEAEETLKLRSDSYLDCVDSKEKLGARGKDLKGALDTAQKALDNAEAQLSKADRRLAQLTETRRDALAQKNMAIQEIELAKRQKTRLEERRDEQRRLIEEEFVTGAERISVRVPVEEGVTPVILDQRLEKFTKDLEQLEREAGGTREELLLAYQQAKRDYDDARSSMGEMLAVAKALKSTLRQRHHRWMMFRKYIATRARITFQYLLSERNFRGRVLMDHAEKVLDIKVEPDLAKISDAGRETRTLSGGEKSFSTICLLLSIWDAMGSPIRCLDEFDVFMDSVNRATSMSMMVQAARRAVGKQFILITPQSMNNVALGDDVKIHRMSDPERGQTSLAFTQA